MTHILRALKTHFASAKNMTHISRAQFITVKNLFHFLQALKTCYTLSHILQALKSFQTF